jgi:hypothetical protein
MRHETAEALGCDPLRTMVTDSSTEARSNVGVAAQASACSSTRRPMGCSAARASGPNACPSRRH